MVYIKNETMLSPSQVLSHVGIRGNEKADSAAKSALDMRCLKVDVPNTDFKHHLNQYFVSLGNIIGMVRLRTSFILSIWSWEIGSPPTGSAGRMKLSYIMPASVIDI